MLFIAYISIFVGISVCSQKIQYAAVIFRHGDRTPVLPYPTDPWRNQSFWPVKFGELTNIGKRQHYLLGKWLRRRYKNLISDEFDPSEIYVRSTDVDRTLMSAQANLAGMFPPDEKTMWNPELLWQPIPVHTVAEEDDEILSMKKKCKTYEKEKKKFVNSKDYKEKLAKYQGLMNYLTANTGELVKDYTSIEYIYNTLYIETIYNFTLPNWTHSVYPYKMIEPSCHRIPTATPTLARLKAGPLMQQIVGRMKESVKNSTSSLKLSIYSAHDDTVGNILSALGMYDGNCPVYTATVLMELIYDKTTDDHFIRISYRNSTEIVEPYVLDIPYCGEKCTLERFSSLYSNLLTVQWDSECNEQFPGLVVSSFSFFTGLGIFLAICVLHRIYVAKMISNNRSYITYFDINSAKDTPLKT